MISFETALQKVLEQVQNYGTEKIHLSKSENRVLGESVYADRDFPPFDRATKDGIAINSKTLERGERFFETENIAQAGAPQLELKNSWKCIEIMTGALVPKQTDTVIMYEHLHRKNNGFELVQEATKGQNIHYQGSDVTAGTELLRPNLRLTAAEVGALASVGKKEVMVKSVPRIAVIATGDELVDVDKKPLPFQIRKTNSHSLQSLLKKQGSASNCYHLKDDKKALGSSLKEYLQKYDVLLLSGGVSKGKYDFLPETLTALGVEQLFHKVAQRPGKPFWFGIHKTERTVVFAFPGNPVSTFVNFHVYFEPWLDQTLGVNTSRFSVILEEAIQNTTPLTLFKGVKLSLKSGSLYARPISTTGSGDVIGLTKIDGFIQLAPKATFEQGREMPFIPTRTLL